MSRSKNGAPGDEPAAAPTVAEGSANGPSGAPEPGADTQPKRRRGNRGGRRHKKPAVSAETAQTQTETQTQTRRKPSSPRDAYASDRGRAQRSPHGAVDPGSRRRRRRGAPGRRLTGGAA